MPPLLPLPPPLRRCVGVACRMLQAASPLLLCHDGSDCWIPHVTFRVNFVLLRSSQRSSWRSRGRRPMAAAGASHDEEAFVDSPVDFFPDSPASAAGSRTDCGRSVSGISRSWMPVFLPRPRCLRHSEWTQRRTHQGGVDPGDGGMGGANRGGFRCGRPRRGYRQPGRGAEAQASHGTS